MKLVFVLALLVVAAAAERELCHTKPGESSCSEDRLGADCVCAGSATGMSGVCTSIKGFEGPVCVFEAADAFAYPTTWSDLSFFDTVNDAPAHLTPVEGATADNTMPDSFLHKMWELFAHYRVSFNREHETPEEAREAFVNFVDNYRYALNHNSKPEGSSYTMAPNGNYEYSWADFVRRFLNLGPIPAPSLRDTPEDVDVSSLPEKVDWRDKNVLTPVKNQGTCGSCYAVAAVQVIESAWAKKTGTPVPLSMQQPIECSERYGNFKCSGGMPENVYKYVMDGNGLMTEEEYPYKAPTLGTCPSKTGSYTIKSFQNVNGNENNLMKAVSENVCHVSIYVSRNFQLYKNGLLDDDLCLDNRPNHAILAVGYTTVAGKDAWILRNSWNEHWGEKGYLYLARGKNNCNIMAHPSFVELE